MFNLEHGIDDFEYAQIETGDVLTDYEEYVEDSFEISEDILPGIDDGFVEEDEENTTNNLKLAIDQFSDEFITDNEPSVYSVSITLCTLTELSNKLLLLKKPYILLPIQLSRSSIQGCFVTAYV